MLLSNVFYCSNTNIWLKENRPILILALRNYTYFSPCDNLNNGYIEMWLFVTNILFLKITLLQVYNTNNVFKLCSVLKVVFFRKIWNQIFSNGTFHSKQFFLNTTFYKLQILILLRCKYSHSMKYHATYHYNTKTNRTYGP